MPVPKPHKGEKQDAFMARCMHEVSKNKDRTNEQNVAICMDTWRKGPEKDGKNELTENTTSKMNEVPFKNLAGAHEKYNKLSVELASARERLTAFEALEVENADLKTQLEAVQKALTESATLISAQEGALVTKEQVLMAAQSENKQLKTDLEIFKAQCAELEKKQKSVKATARELVAASAGAPAPVDNSEMEMTQDDIAKAMLKETDKTKLNALYRQYKSQQAGKQ